MKRFASERVAGLMERMGLEDDVAIESRLVSKTIESAQTRVEGFNFDIRKRVVEFDDVINKQRETIYAERDKVLRNESLTDTVRTFLDDEVDALVDQYCSDPNPDDWNMHGLANALHAMGLEGDGTHEDDLWEAGGREALTGHLRELVDAKLEAKEAEFGDDWALIERLVLLRTIDSLWVEHLTELDDMRRGIGLRGYAQQDPLNEFRKEAFALYEELRALIRHQLASTIFRVTVQRQAPAQPLGVPSAAGAGTATGAGGAGSTVRTSTSAGGDAEVGASLSAGVTAARALGSAAGASRASPVRGLPAPPPAMRRMQESLGDQPVAGRGAPGGVREGYTPSGQRIGRNDPCYCGSGVKYKKCHGR
jgi:preprotein translocase subunit SecA